MRGVVLVRDIGDAYAVGMNAHRAETTVAEDGVVTLRGVPFLEGSSVEVIVLPLKDSADQREPRRRLRGTPVTLIDPTEPVAANDWEAAG
jgi:hypothetical protein